jgi:hypothetical protein
MVMAGGVGLAPDFAVDFLFMENDCDVRRKVVMSSRENTKRGRRFISEAP